MSGDCICGCPNCTPIPGSTWPAHYWPHVSTDRLIALFAEHAERVAKESKRIVPRRPNPPTSSESSEQPATGLAWGPFDPQPRDAR